MLPTPRHGQRIPICRPNAKEIESPSSDQTVRERNLGHLP